MAENPLKGKFTKTKSNKRLQLAQQTFLTFDQHDKLVIFLKERLDFGNSFRDSQGDRYEIIDKQLMGYIKRDPQDAKRDRDNKKGKGPKATKENLPLALVQLHELQTYLMSVFAPEIGIYSAIAPKAKQPIAKGFARLLNKQAKTFKHYPNYAKGLLDMAKYNFGGFVTEWDKIFGAKIGTDNSGSVSINTEITFEGNKVQAIDPYNFIYDISVSTNELHTKGEFFALIDIIRPFHVKRMLHNGEIFNGEDIVTSSIGEFDYYREKPEIYVDSTGSSGGIKDWSASLTTGDPNPKDLQAIEFITYYGWIVPKDHGLNKEDNYQIWRFTIMNGQRIVAAEPMLNAHGMLPIALGRAWDDGFEAQAKAFSEHLLPYQNAASFVLNSKTAADRKKIVGLTIYNKQVFPDIPELEDGVGQIPGNAPKDFDIGRALKHYTEAPDTRGSMSDIAALHDLMQRILPTDIAKQVASLERATQYQAAATVQGGNQRNYFIAKLIDANCMSTVRMQMQFNTLQYQENTEVFDENGLIQQIDVKEFREIDMELIPGGGLIGVDKLLIIEGMRDVIHMMLQSQVANERIDIVSIINYWTTLLGDSTDFNQFKFESPFDALSVEQKNMAMQLLQQFVQQQQTQQPTPNQPAAV